VRKTAVLSNLLLAVIASLLTPAQLTSAQVKQGLEVNHLLGLRNPWLKLSYMISPDHQFIASWTDLASGVVSRSSLPYTMPDATPAAFPDKLLGVRVFTPNCIGTQMLVDDVETTFDNVMISGFDN